MRGVDGPLRGRLLLNVGARRSGTYWLQRIITAHPDIASIPSETYLFSHGIAPLLERFHHGTMSSPQVGSVWADREMLLDRVRDLCDAVLSPFAGEARLIAERTPFHVQHLEMIDEIYPDVRVIHIIRDGRDVARSLVAQSWGPSSIGEAATEWRDSVLSGRAAQLGSGQYREVRYEDLLGDPEAGIRDLYGWLGVELNDAIVDRALAEARRKANVGIPRRGAAQSGGWRRAWSEAELAEFEALAGDLLRELGYETGTRGHSPVLGALARRWRGRAADRPQTPALGAQGRAGPGQLAQVAADRVVEALEARGGRDRLGELLDDEVGVEVVAERGVERGRGENGIELLRRRAREDAAFAGARRRADVRIGIPWTATILGYETAAGALTNRLLCTRCEDDRVREIVLYAFGDG